MPLVLDHWVQGFVGGRGEKLDANAARVGPVFGVQLVGLKGNGEQVMGPTGGLEGIDKGAGEWVGDGEVAGHAPALGVRTGGIEVDGVEGLIGLYGFFVRFRGAGRAGLEELGLCGWLL